MVIAIGQLNTTVGDMEGNVGKMLDLARQAQRSRRANSFSSPKWPFAAIRLATWSRSAALPKIIATG